MLVQGYAMTKVADDEKKAEAEVLCVKSEMFEFDCLDLLDCRGLRSPQMNVLKEAG